MSSIDLKGTTIRITDGSATPNYIDVKIGEGNFSWNEKRELHFVKSRGGLSDVRLGDDIELDVSFQFIWEFITGESSDPPTIEDVLKHKGAAVSWISAIPTNVDPDAPFCVNIVVLYDPICSMAPEEAYVFSQFHYTSLAHSLKDGTVDCQGQCNVSEAFVTRIT